MTKPLLLVFCFLSLLPQKSSGQTYNCDYSNQCQYLQEIMDWKCQGKTPVIYTVVLNTDKTVLTAYSGNNSRTYSITSKEYYSDKNIWDFTVTNNSTNKSLNVKIDLQGGSILFQDNDMLYAYHIIADAQGKNNQSTSSSFDLNAAKKVLNSPSSNSSYNSTDNSITDASFQSTISDCKSVINYSNNDIPLNSAFIEKYYGNLTIFSKSNVTIGEFQKFDENNNSISNISSLGNWIHFNFTFDTSIKSVRNPPSEFPKGTYKIQNKEDMQYPYTCVVQLFCGGKIIRMKGGEVIVTKNNGHLQFDVNLIDKNNNQLKGCFSRELQKYDF